MDDLVYEKVKERIKGSKKTKGPRPALDLSNLGLEELPDDLLQELQKTNLRHKRVDLSKNKLSCFRSELLSLGAEIDLTDNPVNEIQPIAGDKSRLSRLIVDMDFVRRFQDSTFDFNVRVHLSDRIYLSDRSFAKHLEWIASTNSKIKCVSSLRIELDKDRILYPILESLGRFENLISLTVRGARLRRLPESIRTLKKLNDLRFTESGLTELPDWLGELGITFLDLSYNRLKRIKSDMTGFSNLTYLYLDNNPLTELPDFIFNLPKLVQLYAENCSLTSIPESIVNASRLIHVDFKGNPIQSPPESIVAKGLEAIRGYWLQREHDELDYLSEGKLIILGEAGAGKTSLVKKILDPNAPLDHCQKSTEGIDIASIEFDTHINAKTESGEQQIQQKYKVNIWDFGGQEIYHATHQFFLTRRSFYILVCDNRQEDTDFGYWLKVVELLSDASPIVILQNEKQDRKRDINLSDLRGQFANLKWAKQGNLDNNRGLSEFVEAVKKEMTLLPHIGHPLLASWKRVKEHLESLNDNYISLNQFLDICATQGFKSYDDKLQLSSYLNDIGVCLHFQDDPLLKQKLILNPTWGTDAVYRVLDNPDVIQQKGRFSHAQLKTIWHEEEYKPVRDDLLQLMLKFELCYPVERSAFQEKPNKERPNADQASKEYIAPQLLSYDRPEFTWDQADNLTIVYKYEFLPKSIITQLIVSLYKKIEFDLHLMDHLVWKTGCVIKQEVAEDNSTTRARIVEKYQQRRIEITIQGPHQSGLLSIIDEYLSNINDSFKKLKVSKIVPCNCQECQQAASPNQFKIENLIKSIERNSDIQCYESFLPVDPVTLLQNSFPHLVSKTRNSWKIVAHSADFRSDISPEISPEINRDPKTGLMPRKSSKEVYVSYSWDDSSEFVDELQVLLPDDLQLLRDKKQVHYKDSIGQFMQNIGDGDAVIVVISENYLRSEYCMTELYKLQQHTDFKERIFPVVLRSSGIYDNLKVAELLLFWESKHKELKNKLDQLQTGHDIGLRKSLDLYSEFRRILDPAAGIIADMNALQFHERENDSESKNQNFDFGALFNKIQDK